jgi:hypothetical protein
MTTCHRFDDEALLRLERGEPLDEHFATCPDCLAARAAYERLQAALAGAGADDEPPAGWEARVWERIAETRRPRRPAWRWEIAAGAAAALAACLFFFLPRTPAALALRQEVVAGETAVRASAAHPGDRLRLEAGLAGAPYAELRVYRNGRDLVLRCPGDRSCQQTRGMLSAELTIAAPGTYQAVLVAGDRPLPPPGAGLDQDAGAAFAAGAQLLRGEEITAR